MLRHVAFAMVCALTACGPTQQYGLDASAGDGEPDASHAPDAEPGPGPDAIAGAYNHTIEVDGINDFSAAFDRLPTSSGSFTTYVSWDETYLYFGMQGPDVASGSAQTFWLIYIGGPGGTMVGENYNTQQPSLPFPALYHLRWKANNTFTSAKQFEGGAWQEAGWLRSEHVSQTSTFVELRVAREDIGSLTAVRVHMSMINEAANVEGTFAGSPANSFSDGYDPDYTRYFEFDLSAALPPSAHPPLP